MPSLKEKHTPMFALTGFGARQLEELSAREGGSPAMPRPVVVPQLQMEPPRWLTDLLGCDVAPPADCAAAQSGEGSPGATAPVAAAGATATDHASEQHCPAQPSVSNGGFRPFRTSLDVPPGHAAEEVPCDVTSPRSASPLTLFSGLGGATAAATMRRINSSELSAVFGLVAAAWPRRWGPGAAVT